MRNLEPIGETSIEYQGSSIQGLPVSFQRLGEAYAEDEVPEADSIEKNDSSKPGLSSYRFKNDPGRRSICSIILESIRMPPRRGTRRQVPQAQRARKVVDRLRRKHDRNLQTLEAEHRTAMALDHRAHLVPIGAAEVATDDHTAVFVTLHG